MTVEKRFLQINLNDRAIVYLTDFGLLLMRQHYGENFFKANVDTSDNSLQMQIWKMMEVFGPFLRDSTEDPINMICYMELDFEEQTHKQFIEICRAEEEEERDARRDAETSSCNLTRI